MKKKAPEGAFFKILCPYAGRAHKRTNRGPLMNLPDQRKYPLDSSRLWDSPLRAQTDSCIHSADRTEEQGYSIPKRWNLNLQLSLTAVCSERTIWADLHCTLSLPKNLNAGKPLSVRGRWAESHERFTGRGDSQEGAAPGILLCAARAGQRRNPVFYISRGKRYVKRKKNHPVQRTGSLPEV